MQDILSLETAPYTKNERTVCIHVDIIFILTNLNVGMV